MMEVEIKPCPWCGEMPEVFGSMVGVSIIECVNQACDVCPSTKLHGSMRDAAREWNSFEVDDGRA